MFLLARTCWAVGAGPAGLAAAGPNFGALHCNCPYCVRLKSVKSCNNA